MVDFKFDKKSTRSGGFGYWRRVWDSNPREVTLKRFSRPPRYDRFDNPPYGECGEKSWVNGFQDSCPSRNIVEMRALHSKSSFLLIAVTRLPRRHTVSSRLRSPVMTASIILRTEVLYHNRRDLSRTKWEKAEKTAFSAFVVRSRKPVIWGATHTPATSMANAGAGRLLPPRRSAFSGVTRTK